MKKILLLAIGTAMLVACQDNVNTDRDALQHQCDSLKQIISDKDTELNDIMGSIAEVQEGIQRINDAEGRVLVANGSPESGSSKEVIRENMQYIEEAMAQNKELIAQLKEKLKTTTFNADKLQKTIENLQAQIDKQNQRIQELEATLADRDAQIAEQGQQIDNLNQSVTTLTTQTQTQQQTITTQDAELNTAWFVFGTKAELKEQKILQSGDVLKSSNFNKDYFTKIDIRKDKDIKLYSKSAQVLTNHPADSYSLTKDSKGQYELHITNATKFWSVSKYLVIQVK